MKNEKIAFIWDTVVDAIMGEEEKGVTGAHLRHITTGGEQVLSADGIFVAIGHTPTTQLFEGQLKLDQQGYIVTDPRMHTSVEGVFAAGDVADHVYRQAVTAAGTGCAAAIDAERWLESQHG